MTREQWLHEAWKEMRGWCEAVGEELPEAHLSIGFPSKMATSRKAKRIGECWCGKASADGKAHVFVSPLHDTPAAALSTLLHEAVHACGHSGHKGGFVKMAKALGFTKPWKSTPESPELKARLEALAEKLGPWGHAKLVPVEGAKKQTTRLLKAMPPCCEYTIRVTQKWADVGLPECPEHGEAFELV